jgi:cytochrome oxidase Cu insertion factor (SCO1/SenC/PrrC family)
MKTKLSLTLLLIAVGVLAVQARLQPQKTAHPDVAAPIGIGMAALDFTLEDEKGNKVTLSTEYKKQPVLLTFYRGYW